MEKIIIIGAGLAGLSLATELVDEGLEVVILEKQNLLGGRASNIYDKEMKDPVHNGPHVFVSAYNNLQNLFDKIDAKSAILWQSEVFLEMVYKGEHAQFKLNNLPPGFYALPWMLSYKFISAKDKLSMLGFVKYIATTSFEDMEELDEQDAYSFLKEKGVTDKGIDNTWRMLAMSLLNVPLEECSATEFAIMTKHWSRLEHNKFGFAKVGLGDAYVHNAREYITSRGGKIISGAEVKKIEFIKGEIDHVLVEMDGIQSRMEADSYVSTLAPHELTPLLVASDAEQGLIDKTNKFEPVPYIAVNLWFDKKISDKKFWAMLAENKDKEYLNTDFYDQSNIFDHHQGGSFIASNIIYSQKHEGLSDQEIIDRTLSEIEEAFPAHEAKLVHSHIHRLPYVIYAPKPGLRKYIPDLQTSYPNFMLAGDWITKELPQCMESAVRSGYRTAEAILQKNGVEKQIVDPRVH